MRNFKKNHTVGLWADYGGRSRGLWGPFSYLKRVRKAVRTMGAVLVSKKSKKSGGMESNFDL